MNSLIRFLSRAVSRHPRTIIALHALFVVGAGVVAATNMTVDTTIDGLMTAGDPDLVASQQLKTEFTNDEVVVVAFDLQRPFDRSHLEHLDRITRRIAEVPGVTESVSLASVEDVRPDGAGGIDASPLLDPERIAALDDIGLEALRARVKSHALYPGNLVSKDLDALALIVGFEPPLPGKTNIRAATAAIEDILKAEGDALGTIRIAGYPVLEAEADMLVKQDMITLTPFAFLIMLLIVFLVARRFFSLLLLCALALWTAAVAIAYFALSGTPLNILTAEVPSILFCTSSVYGIFVMGLLQTVQGTPDPALTIIEVATRPSFLSMSSTVVGFLSLLFIQIDAVREMGIGLALGTFGSFTATLLLLPALVKLADFRAPPVHWKWVERWSTVGVRWSDRPWRVIGAVTALVVVCIPGWMALYIDTNPFDYFRDSSPTIQAHDFVNEELGGGAIMSVVVRTGRPEGALTPEVAHLVAALEAEATRTDMVDHSVSLFDYLALIDGALALEPGAAPRRILPSAQLASQYLLLYESGGGADDLKPYINGDRSALNMRLRIRYLSSRKVADLHDRLEHVAARFPEAKAEVRLLGSAFMLAKSSDSISAGLIPGFIAALLVVFFTFWLTLGSWKLALIAIPPNVLPYAFCMAVMGYAGVSISIGSSLVGFIAIGLAVDDTAHLLSHLRDGASMRRVYREVGMPVLLTSLALGLGFSILVFSQFAMVAVFGIATGVTLGTAVLGDIILLPSILRLCGYELDKEGEAGADPAPAHRDGPALPPVGEPTA